MSAPVAAPPANEPSASGDALVQLCAFVVGEEEYAVDIMRIREIIQPMRITPVPRAPRFIEGVINLRGAIIPVVDLRKRLGLTPAPPTKRMKFLICSVGGRRVGLVVDAVTEVLRLPRSEIKRTPGLLDARGRYFVGVCGPQDRLKLLLNVKALLASDEEVPGEQSRALARGGTR